MGKTKLNIPMLAALILLFLTMLSTYLTCGLYARYTATASGSASARVAKFDVQGSLDKSDITVNCTSTSKSGAYQITVENKSEVAINYVIFVTLDQDVAETDLWVKMDGTKGTVSKVMKFTRGPLAPGASIDHTFELGIDKWRTVTEKVNDQASYDWVLDFTVEIQAEQID